MTDKSITDNNGGYKFKFSVIMAVYMVEEFIEEAIESLVSQTVGFENIQIILSDDGSPDRSGEICDMYKEKYPDNIVVIHKENGGPGSARNAALPYAEGRYVSFMDPDDTVSPDTFERVYEFFSENDAFTDYVAIPMFFFGTRTGAHHLNSKFNGGTRVIDLFKEPQFSQYSEASAFIKHDVAVAQKFNERMVVAEDAQQIIRILINKPTLGVVKEGCYNYRRRDTSLVSTGSTKKEWYCEYLKSFGLSTFDYAMEKFGYIPKFVQHTVMQDMQWKFAEAEEPKVLSPEEILEYNSLLMKCLSYIDTDVILAQRHLSVECKTEILKMKAKLPFIMSNGKDITYGEDDVMVHRFSNNIFQLSFLEFEGDNVVLTARQSVLAMDLEHIEKIYAKVGEEVFESDYLEYELLKTSIGKPVSYWALCRFTIPEEALRKEPECTVALYTKTRDTDVLSRNVRAGIFMPMTTSYNTAFYSADGLAFSVTKRGMKVETVSKKQLRRKKRAFFREVWKQNKLGARKAILARALAAVYKFFHRKPLWLITDRLNKAGDNGEAFFLHLKKEKFKGADFRFAIGKCPDYYRLKKQGRVLDFNSWKYKLLFLAADVVISSQGEDFITNPFGNYCEPNKDIIRVKKYVFLQHGVIKDDLSGWLTRYNKNISGFITSAKGEWDSIVNGNYHYSADQVWLTGLPRFDRLYHDERKYITIMPTWRRYLMAGLDNSTGVWKESVSFITSDYFDFYNRLINDERLLSAAAAKGYTVCFMPHPNTITKIDCFKKDERVRFLSINDAYKDVYAQSNLVLTDYSSAVFDFAYLGKPIVYTHFDKEEFFAGEHVYTQGYFDYERDGFGEVVYDYEATVDMLIEYIENDCRLKDKYRKRIDGFFAYTDRNNCNRILEKILKLK